MSKHVAIVRFVLLRAMVAQPDLVLIVEPGLIVVSSRSVEHLLTEALWRCLRITSVAVDLFVAAERQVNGSLARRPGRRTQRIKARLLLVVERIVDFGESGLHVFHA